jgi:hypothetical protein
MQSTAIHPSVASPASQSQTVAPADNRRCVPFDRLVESLWRHYVNTDRVPVLVFPESVEPRTKLLVSLAQSLAKIADRPVRIDWCPSPSLSGWWVRQQRQRWVRKAHRSMGSTGVDIQLTNVIGRQIAASGHASSASWQRDATQDKDWFRIGISGSDAEIPDWADPILLAL